MVNLAFVAQRPKQELIFVQGQIYCFWNDLNENRIIRASAWIDIMEFE